MEADYQLSGSNAYAARFGETIADLGDLDDDGYNGKNPKIAAISFLSHLLLANSINTASVDKNTGTIVFTIITENIDAALKTIQI